MILVILDLKISQHEAKVHIFCLVVCVDMPVSQSNVSMIMTYSDKLLKTVSTLKNKRRTTGLETSCITIKNHRFVYRHQYEQRKKDYIYLKLQKLKEDAKVFFLLIYNICSFYNIM